MSKSIKVNVNGTKTVTVDNKPSFDVAANANFGQSIYDVINGSIAAQESAQDNLETVLIAAMEAKPESFEMGEHVAGPLVESFGLFIARTEKLLTDCKPLDKADTEGTKEYKKLYNNELSKFRVMASRSLAKMIPEAKVGFSNPKAGINVKIALKEEAKTQTVAEWLTKGIAVYGATDVLKAMLENADIKVVMEAINQQQAS